MSLFDQLSSETWALEKALTFTEARNRVLTENIANIDTPGYHTKQLDPGAFQSELKDALSAQRENPSAPAQLCSSSEFQLGPDGGLVVTPGESPVDNVLFHDGTNARIEQQMALLAENGMMHQILTELIRGTFSDQMNAIKGHAT